MRCPTCDSTYEDGVAFCPVDGARLIAEVAKSDDPLIGAVLEGRYRVDALLGSGGFGTVYRGLQVNVEREVAIKVLSAEASRSEEQVRRFQNEARIISRLRHPNTLKLIDTGRTADARLFLVTELLIGSPLDQVLDRGPLDTATTLLVGAQICEALAEAHEAGIVHRDLKPANIMIEPMGAGRVAKVLDFGIARLSHQSVQTASGVVFGTPAYLSPEQARGLRVDHRSDLYSLGVLLYECVSGGVPFTGSTPMSLLLKHHQEAPPPLAGTTYGSRAPAALVELVHQLLAKSPDERPADAMAVHRALTAIDPLGSPVAPEAIEGIPVGVSAAEVGIAEMARPARRWPLLIGATAVVIAGWLGTSLLDGSDQAAQVLDGGASQPAGQARVAMDAAIAKEARPEADAAPVVDAAPPPPDAASALADVEGPPDASPEPEKRPAARPVKRPRPPRRRQTRRTRPRVDFAPINR